MRILGISSSPSVASRSNRLLAYISNLLDEAGLHVDNLRVRDLPASDLILANWDSPSIAASSAQLKAADFIIIATPVYKAAYSGLLKVFLDLQSQDALKNKRIATIATGGSLAHMLALDYSLKPVLSAMGARHIVGSVYGVDQQVQIDQAGNFRLDPDLQERLNDLTQVILDNVKPDSELGLAARSELSPYLHHVHHAA